MSVSTNSTEQDTSDLLANLWDEIEFFKAPLIDLRHGDAVRISQVLILAAHRLAFLEMVVKGLAEMEKHDAQAYAKFIEKKRKIEDLDIDELRVLLR